MSDDVLNSTAQSQLKALIERYERLAVEKAEIEETQKEVLAEVKGLGFDKAVFLEAIKVRKQDQTARAERGAILSLYLEAAK